MYKVIDGQIYIQIDSYIDGKMGEQILKNIDGYKLQYIDRIIDNKIDGQIMYRQKIKYTYSQLDIFNV